MAGGVDYRHVFEGAHEAQLLLDGAANVVAASDGYLRAVGRTRPAVIGRSMFELPPYAGTPTSTAHLRYALTTMHDAALPTTPVQLADDPHAAPVLWSQAKLWSIPGASGAIEYVVHVLESKAGGQERSESDAERRLRKLVEHTYDAIVLFDAHGRVAYVSPAVQRVIGFTEAEFVAMNPFEPMHPDDQARFGQELSRLLSEPGGLSRTRFRARHRDGRYRVLENTAVNRLHDPDVAAIVATYREVTEEVELHDELRRSATRLQVALNAAKAISWDWNIAERRGSFSSDVGEFFGRAPGVPYDGLDRPWFVHAEDSHLLTNAWRRALETGEALHLEYRGEGAGAHTRRYAVHGQVVRDESGQPVRMVGVTWDVTERWRMLEERRLLEQRMQESQKLESLGVLAGGIAHDFSNLLMVILGNIGLLRRELGERHPSLLLVEPMEEATRRATDLCRQLLAYAGKGRFILQHASINHLIDETTHLLQVSISKKAALQFHLDERLPPVVVDATQIRQVLMNLVINASDAIGDRSGTISLTTFLVRADRAYLDATFMAPDIPAGDYVCLEVRDTGTGMSAETQSRIFDPFFTTKFTGRGLGLAAVLGIVRGHKGALKVYSELGKGSSFKLLLPVAPDSTEELPRSRGRARALSVTGTILVVDDEAAVRNVASRLLKDLGFATRLAEDGNAALAVYREHAAEIVCVLMDLTMPGLDGAEAFRELRRINPDVRVLLMSGYNEQDAIARFVGRGVAGFIQKPFTFEELERRLRELLA